MKISFIFILFLFCSLHSYGTTPKIKVYCNPVLAKSTPDPTVIQAPDGMFYLYATEDIHNIPIYKSPDLVNWTFVGTAFTDATRPTFEPKAGLWAPDINHIDGKYVLYYAMSRWGGEHTCGIGCAVADSPAGPFTNQGKLFRSNEIGVQNSIDPFYIEENGEKYLFWGSFRGIYYIELSEDGLHIRPGAKPTQIAGTAYEAVYVHKRQVLLSVRFHRFMLSGRKKYLHHGRRQVGKPVRPLHGQKRQFHARQPPRGDHSSQC